MPHINRGCPTGDKYAKFMAPAVAKCSKKKNEGWMSKHVILTNTQINDVILNHEANNARATSCSHAGNRPQINKLMIFHHG